MASENRKLNLALQCWKILVLDSTSHTDLGALLMHCIEIGRSEDYIWQVVSDAFSSEATATLKSRAFSPLAFRRWKGSFQLEAQTVFFRSAKNWLMNTYANFES